MKESTGAAILGGAAPATRRFRVLRESSSPGNQANAGVEGPFRSGDLSGWTTFRMGGLGKPPGEAGRVNRDLYLKDRDRVITRPESFLLPSMNQTTGLPLPAWQGRAPQVSSCPENPAASFSRTSDFTPGNGPAKNSFVASPRDPTRCRRSRPATRSPPGDVQPGPAPPSRSPPPAGRRRGWRTCGDSWRTATSSIPTSTMPG